MSKDMHLCVPLTIAHNVIYVIYCIYRVACITYAARSVSPLPHSCNRHIDGRHQLTTCVVRLLRQENHLTNTHTIHF